ncbi:hypothetical protein J6Z37_01995 [Candidatus Saccharibacteria bacterium]|nr:hypothetical protein [Candidatus Saccharibacteria bacterium]
MEYSFTEVGGGFFANLLDTILAQPAWLIVLMMVYLVAQILFLIIRKNTKKWFKLNLLFLFLFLIIDRVINLEVMRYMSDSSVSDASAHLGMSFIGDILKGVVLIVGAIVTSLITRSSLDSQDITLDGDDRSQDGGGKGLIIADCAVGALFFSLLLASSVGVRADVFVKERKDGRIVARDNYSLNAKKGQLLRLGDKRVEILDVDNDNITVSYSRNDNNMIQQKLLWNKRYEYEGEQYTVFFKK